MTSESRTDPEASTSNGLANSISDAKEQDKPTASSCDGSESSQFSRRDTNWLNVLLYIYLHLTAMYGIFLIFKQAYLATTLLAFVLIFVAPYGVTMGAHRLWAHRCFQASFGLRALLIFLHTLNAQGPLYDWVKDHRFHHAYRGSKLDPYNPKRGFWFVHMNHKFVQRPPEMDALRETIDVSDLEQDSLVMFQKRFYWVLMPVLSFLLPINLPVEYWGESVLTSFFVMGMLRHVVLLNVAWLVHSGPIIWGLRQGEIVTDSNLVFLVRKSRWHDYHYFLPWDYRTGEYGAYGVDLTTRLIEMAARNGFVTKLRTSTDDDITAILELSIQEGIPLEESVKKVMKDKLEDNELLSCPKHRDE